MRYRLIASVLVVAPVCAAQGPLAPPTSSTTSVVVRSDFHIRYINGTSVYIDGGRNAGLVEGTKLVLKQSPEKTDLPGQNAPVEPGVIAKLTVVAVATTSAVCDVVSTSRPLKANDIVSLPEAELEKRNEKQLLGNARKYPMIMSFTEGDPLDEEVRETVPHPPLPEIN